MNNPRFIYRMHATLEGKIKRNRYLPFVDTINNIDFNTNIISMQNSRGETLLHIAIKFKRIHIIQYLVNHCEYLKTIKNYRGETPFFYACKYGYIFIVRLFLNNVDYRSFIDIKDNNLYSPLLKSYKANHLPIANLLLEKGADWNVMARDGYVIPQYFIYNFINRRRFQQLSFSPISSPLSNRLSTFSTPAPSSPPTPSSPQVTISYPEPSLEFPANSSADSATEQFTFGSFNTFDVNFLLDDSPLKLVKPNNEIINLIKELYVDKKEMCPVAYEPLTLETTSITSCYHFFNKDAIENWFKTKNTCPVCRERCEIW